MQENQKYTKHSNVQTIQTQFNGGKQYRKVTLERDVQKVKNSEKTQEKSIMTFRIALETGFIPTVMKR